MSSVYASTTAGTVGFTVAQPGLGYTIVSTGLSPITTTDGYALYRFHSSGTLSISGITQKTGTATLQIMCVGGGSSGCSGSYANGGGTGGSAGGFIESTVSLSQNQTINITVGNGGLGAQSYTTFAVNNGENSIISFSINSEYNMTAYGGTGTMSGAPTANAPGAAPYLSYPGMPGGGGSGGVGMDGPYAGGGNGGPGKKPTKPGILTQYPTIYWAGGGGGSSGYSERGAGGIGGGGAGSSSQGAGLQGANGYGGTALQSGNAQQNSGSAGGYLSQSTGIGGSGIIMIAVKIPV